MNTVDAILNAMDEILGLDKDEMRDMLDINLLEEGLVDSLSIITLLSAIEDSVDHAIEIEKMTPEDLSTVHRLAAAIDRQV